jgi:hypothetical protein
MQSFAKVALARRASQGKVIPNIAVLTSVKVWNQYLGYFRTVCTVLFSFITLTRVIAPETAFFSECN